MTEAEAHQHFAAACFDEAWTWLEKESRTEKEDERMVAAAQASLYHWLNRGDCTEQNLSIGYWQISRVYAVLERAQEARAYAERCVAVSEKANLTAFFTGFAYEALCRSLLLDGERDEAAACMDMAKSLEAKVTVPGDREMLAKDLQELEAAFSKE